MLGFIRGLLLGIIVGLAFTQCTITKRSQPLDISVPVLVTGSY